MAAGAHQGAQETRKTHIGIGDRAKQKNALNGVIWRSEAIALYPAAAPVSLSLRRRLCAARSDQKRANVKPRAAEAVQGIRKARNASGLMLFIFLR